VPATLQADINNVMQFFYPFFAQLFTAPATLVAALVLLWFQIRRATHVGQGPGFSRTMHQGAMPDTRQRPCRAPCGTAGECV
jgi:hypothetical protein